jgi:translation elongation factor EF-4
VTCAEGSLSHRGWLLQVFASVYPVDTGEFTALEQAVRPCCFVTGRCADHSVSTLQINKLLLTDSSVFTIRENSVSLGMGLRCGFLGLLHMDVFFQRLQMEFDTPVIYTAPYVPYTLVGLIPLLHCGCSGFQSNSFVVWCFSETKIW